MQYIAVISLFVLGLSVPAFAQSGLGVVGAHATLGAMDGDAFVGAKIDVAVTEFHGLQGDLHFADEPGGTFGILAGHAYMTPAPGQKYGLFATLGDVDGHSRSYGVTGVEGLFAVGNATSFELRTGLGASQPDGIDLIFAEAGIVQGVFPGLTVEAGLTVSEIDEIAMQTMLVEARLGAQYRPRDRALGGFAEIVHDDLAHHPATGRTELRVGLSLTLGRLGATAPKGRAFRTADPLRPLFRRGAL